MQKVLDAAQSQCLLTSVHCAHPIIYRTVLRTEGKASGKIIWDTFQLPIAEVDLSYLFLLTSSWFVCGQELSLDNLIIYKSIYAVVYFQSYIYIKKELDVPVELHQNLLHLRAEVGS